MGCWDSAYVGKLPNFCSISYHIFNVILFTYFPFTVSTCRTVSAEHIKSCVVPLRQFSDNLSQMRQNKVNDSYPSAHKPTKSLSLGHLLPVVQVAEVFGELCE